nr:unnamed protein product [Callosobruchus chinensis]
MAPKLHQVLAQVFTVADLGRTEAMSRARKYFSSSNLDKLHKAQIRPSLEYCSHVWGAAAPTTLSILDAVLRRAIRLIAVRMEKWDTVDAANCPPIRPVDKSNNYKHKRHYSAQFTAEYMKCREAVETAKHVIFDCPSCAGEEARIWNNFQATPGGGKTGEHSPMHHTVRKEPGMGVCLNPVTGGAQ